jgi:hypothetical protein
MAGTCPGESRGSYYKVVVAFGKFFDFFEFGRGLKGLNALIFL